MQTKNIKALPQSEARTQPIAGVVPMEAIFGLVTSKEVNFGFSTCGSSELV